MIKYKHSITVSCLLAIFLTQGCTTRAAKKDFAELPTSSKAFHLSKTELIEKYPEVKNYELGQSKIGWCSEVNQLEEKWGKPDEINTDWMNIPLLIVPIAFIDGVTTGGLIVTGAIYSMGYKQPKHYIWKKGDYSIDAYVTNNQLCNRKDIVQYWDWEHKSEI